ALLKMGSGGFGEVPDVVEQVAAVLLVERGSSRGNPADSGTDAAVRDRTPGAARRAVATAQHRGPHRHRPRRARTGHRTRGHPPPAGRAGPGPRGCRGTPPVPGDGDTTGWGGDRNDEPYPREDPSTGRSGRWPFRAGQRLPPAH